MLIKRGKQFLLLYVLVLFEIGIFLLFVPWSGFWERNYFLQAYPTLTSIVLSPTFRGAVCGLGFGNIYLAVLELFNFIRRHRSVSQGVLNPK